ncbi:hypothetical protein TNCT_335441 [Trichonephila clavata]|uniref:Uncharacterized protein n=1 Tax=Trichonephila clavata TaxID=2740835 RepID=A0A8X6ILG9_TRICU|nr:hypothetical protein TNCT_335441 [Trichonephila clavata]
MLVLFLVACVAFVHGVIGYPSNSENHENSVQSSDRNYKCDFENGLCSFLRNSPYNWETWKLFQGKIFQLILGHRWITHSEQQTAPTCL